MCIRDSVLAEHREFAYADEGRPVYEKRGSLVLLAVNVAVSYTHLYVYKRQGERIALPSKAH